MPKFPLFMLKITHLFYWVSTYCSSHKSPDRLAQSRVPWQDMPPAGHYLSTQSDSLDVKLDAGASWPPMAYKNPFQVVTPTPPLLFDI